MLGHENLETTVIYTYVAIEKLKAIHAATHPAFLDRTPGADARRALRDMLGDDTFDHG
jgi:integrase/recombinase XerD